MMKTSAACLGVLAASLWAASCGGSNNMGYGSTPTSSTSATTTPSAAASVVVTINGINGGMSFSPDPATVQAGQTVAWKNADTTSHTATQDGGGFDTGAIAPGATSKAITMSTPGTLKYHCSFHPSMVGSVTVGAASGGGY